MPRSTQSPTLLETTAAREIWLRTKGKSQRNVFKASFLQREVDWLYLAKSLRARVFSLIRDICQPLLSIDKQIDDQLNSFMEK